MFFNVDFPIIRKKNFNKIIMVFNLRIIMSMHHANIHRVHIQC